jgi:hypothetical protein
MELAKTFRPSIPTTSNALAIGTAVAPSFAFLTPDTLLAYCESKLRGIDEQVQRTFAGQEKRNRLNTALSELSDKLSKHQNVIGPDDKDIKADIEALYQNAIDAAGPDTELGKQLAQQKADFHATATGTSTQIKGDQPDIAAWEMKNFMDSVQRMQGDANRQGELEMIQLQSLMSQRQQALQMCTNMVSGLGQSSREIAANVGK